MFLLNGKPLALDTAFTDSEGIQRPANWLRLASPEEREAIGITEEPDPAPYDQRFYWGYDSDGVLIPKQLEDETTTPEDGEPYTTTGLKTLWRSQTSQTASTLLSPTDWYIVRETDTGVPCPTAIRTWRQSIRDLAADKSASIDGCTSVDELAAYITSGGIPTLDLETNEPVVDPTTAYSYWPPVPAPEPETVCDYRLFYDALLVSPAYSVIREKAVTSAPVLTACVEFIAAIGDAKSGRPNPAAIQACVDLLCAASQFTPEELLLLADVMSVGGLDQVYTIPTL